MQFASVKIGGMPGEPFHKNQKLKWDHKVLFLLCTVYRCIVSLVISVT